MKDFKFIAKKGRVKSFNYHTGTGRVVVGNSTFSFETTSFRSASPIRYPRSGELIEAVLSEDGQRLISVWEPRLRGHALRPKRVRAIASKKK